MKATTERLLFAVGSLTVVLAAVPYRAFDLDRFFSPKELALHALALALALPALRRAKALKLTLTDLFLALYLALGLVSALFAPDRWLAARALAVSFSGAAVFWCVRGLKEEERRGVLAVVCGAAVVAAGASLAQAYGFQCALFSPLRAPGGTLGNRNFVAHIAAVCAPVLVLCVLRARRSAAALAGLAGVSVLAAVLVVTRSRAALLGLAAGAAVLAYGCRRMRVRLEDQGAAFRLKALLAAAALGVVLALTLPSKLRWRSGSPYLDTLTGLADYHDGSGRARIVQYERSLRMAAARPVLGAGPGNWSVAYPLSVKDFDRSIDYTTGRTINPWPSSDWIAVLCERGVPALAALLAVFLCLFLGAWRRATAGAEPALEGYVLACALACAAVVGCFDVFLLLPASSLLLWGLAGALAADSPVIWFAEPSPRARRSVMLAAAILWGFASLRASGQIVAMSLDSAAHSGRQVARALLFDPDNIQIRLRLKALRAPVREEPAK